ncbi:RNA polymerase sigma factor [Micromonospora sp. NBC_01813]|uniref:RNA polymerase sigma factor n=1 Tax=Micromonospora sp. NBC_01813 TaxID=2975988 RepID=UPI002DDB4E8B|nr:sigma-70 family RNA polymerase sigma factor [Micromonospora sp. NBC_01813]WSA06252.1 sigma-70 family RNA polymerase sigma factor [Micromonospora sp. NBC_01813]
MTTDLRARARAGEPAAFGELFDRYAKTVYNHAFRLTADWASAEDVMSTTFLQAWRLRARIDADGGSLRAWLLGIATNVARNAQRSNRRYRAAVCAYATAEAAGGGSVADHADDVGRRLDDDRRLGQVLGALATLRRPEREVVTLCLWEELDYATAAAALGVPIGTVRSRLSRARRKLRDLLDAPQQHLAERMEPAPLPGQVIGNRNPAARTVTEGIR